MGVRLENTVRTAVEICFLEIAKCYFKSALLEVLHLRHSQHDCDDRPHSGSLPSLPAAPCLPAGDRLRRPGTPVTGHQRFLPAATSRKGTSLGGSSGKRFLKMSPGEPPPGCSLHKAKAVMAVYVSESPDKGLQRPRSLFSKTA